MNTSRRSKKELEAKLQENIVKGQSVPEIAEALEEEVSMIQPNYDKLVAK